MTVSPSETFRITGHRGAKDLAPENTMRSFQLAIDLGVDAVELDVHLSSDGEVVVIHDDTLDRTTNGSGAVTEHSLAALTALDAGDGERIPRLVDVLDRFPATRIQIEVKDLAATAKVVELLQARKAREGTTMITSFFPEVLRLAALDGRHWELGLICRHHTEGTPEIATELGADQVLAHWNMADNLSLIAYRENGGRVSIAPADSQELVERAITEGYMGITANDPRLALAARAKMLGANGA